MVLGMGQALLKKWIKDKGWTHLQASDAIGCDRSTLTGWLTGRRKPDRVMAGAIEARCKIPVASWDKAARTRVKK